MAPHVKVARLRLALDRFIISACLDGTQWTTWRYKFKHVHMVTNLCTRVIADVFMCTSVTWYRSKNVSVYVRAFLCTCECACIFVKWIYAERAFSREPTVIAIWQSDLITNIKRSSFDLCLLLIRRSYIYVYSKLFLSLHLFLSSP